MKFVDMLSIGLSFSNEKKKALRESHSDRCLTVAIKCIHVHMIIDEIVAITSYNTTDKNFRL